MPDPNERRAVALLVGVGRYRHGISPLGFAARDARALARLAADPDVCAFPRDGIRLLADEKATRAGMSRALSRWLPERAQGADLALVYFAGHGVVERAGGREEGYLLPHDADPDDIAGQGISMADVGRWIDRIPARAVVVCLDCCHAGTILPGDGVSLRGDRDLVLSPSVLERLGGKGRFLIASCDRGQKSIEADDLKHGLFTYHLLRGLEGAADRDGDGRVSVAELFAHVAAAVKRDAKERFGREQTPWTHATYTEDVVLSSVRRETPTPAPEVTGEDAALIEELRRLRRRPDGARLPLLFGCLAHTGDEIRQRARQALHAIGWDEVCALTLGMARRGDDVAAVLEGLAALEASERVEGLLGKMVESLKGDMRSRAARLHDRKKLALECPRLASVFRDEKRPYEVVRVLGPGLYTGAYLARTAQGGHEVVLRVLRPEYAMQPMVRGQFLAVSHAAVPMVHHNLVLTRHAEEMPGRGLCYAVRDYVHGATLREVLESGRTFDRPQAVKLLRQVADGLTPLHRAGLAHNGVKPSNVFLAADGRVLLGDPSLPLPPMGWDVPRLAYDLRYASPEMFLPGGPVCASDFYALGCMAHELFTGRPPHVSDSPWELIGMHGKSALDCAGVPGGLRAWVARLLAPTPAARFATLADVLQAMAEDDAPASKKALTPGAPRAMMAADMPSAALLPPESLADAAGRQSILPFTAADGGPVSVMEQTFDHPMSAPREEPAAHSPPGYEIIRTLGRGGMGVVYEARQTSLNRVVALKMILGGGHASPQSRARFRAEAQAVAALQHPNIMAIFDFGEFEGNAFLSMEYCTGGTLSESLRGKPMPPDDAARLVARLARALEHAHERGIIHRDVKPANVLFSGAGVPKLTDFGLARRMEEAEGITASGAVMGTPAYMAPEQATGDSKAAGPAADIYSLGALFYHALTGQPPYQGTTLHELMRKVLHEPPARPSKVRPAVPAALEAVCMGCMERDPTLRYPTAGAVADALEAYLIGDRASAPRRRGAWWWPFG